jgi:hypothetical protein
MLDEAFLIPPAEFAEPRVLELCHAFMVANHGYRVLRYFVVTDSTDARRLLGPGVTDIDFPGWLQDYKTEPQNPPPTAELLKVGEKAVVRFRFRDGKIIERVVGTGNPLEIHYQGEAVKVLDIAPDPPRRIGELPYGGGEQFFIQTARPWTFKLAEGFDKFLHAATGLTSIEMTMEDGWWFAGEVSYPIYNRFLAYTQPPTFEQFKRHTRFYCDDLPPVPGRCIQMGPARQQ